jgi:hypothetical protein
MTKLRQLAFSGGEVSPAIQARPDQIKNQTGLKKCLNTFISREGGAHNRPGLEYVGRTKTDGVAVLIPWISGTNNYALEFGNLYMRVYKLGSKGETGITPVTDVAASGLTGFSAANPCVVGSTPDAHGLTTGDEIIVHGGEGGSWALLNGQRFKVNVTSAYNFELQYPNGTNVNTTSYGTKLSNPFWKRIMTVVTPYTTSQVDDLVYGQSHDVMTITHPSHAPYELTRVSETSWTLAVAAFAPATTAPTTGVGTPGGAGANNYRYQVTAVDATTYEESLAGTETARVITGITQANPAVVTSNAHGYQNGDVVAIASVVGMTQVNNLSFTVAGVTANTFQLSGIDSTGYTAYSSGGTATCAYIGVRLAAAPTGAAPHVLTWAAVSNAREYNVYRSLNGIFGWIGIAGSTTFSDTNFDPDTLDTPTTTRNPFASSGNYPACVGYFQQRRWFGGTNNNPETVEGSKTALPKNMTRSFPSSGDDAVTFRVSGRHANTIKHILDLGELLIFTSAGEWACKGDVDGTVTPTTVNLKQYSYNGSSSLPPLVVGSNALYIQARGNIIRDLTYNWEVNGYRGNDLTVFASHLLEGYTIVSWAFQQTPHSVVWMVRSDGKLLGMTYVREHQVFAWHQHDTDGTFESVTVVPADNEDIPVFIIKRTINGNTRRYVERFMSRQIDPDDPDPEDFIFMDSCLHYHGNGAEVTITGGTLWDETEVLTATTYLGASEFYSTDVTTETEFHLYDSVNLEYIRCRILGYTSANVVSIQPHKTIPVAMRNVVVQGIRAIKKLSAAFPASSTTSWCNLTNLEGKALSILGDGNVVGSPNNPNYATYTVANGDVTFDRAYRVLRMGLPYISDMRTIAVDTTQGETMLGKKKRVKSVTAFVEKTRGVWMGTKPPTDDAVDPLEGLTELKLRDTEGYDEPVDLATGKVDTAVEGTFDDDGSIFIRQVDPLPMSILSVVAEGDIPVQPQGRR